MQICVCSIRLVVKNSEDFVLEYFFPVTISTYMPVQVVTCGVYSVPYILIKISYVACVIRSGVYSLFPKSKLELWKCSQDLGCLGGAFGQA